MTCVSVFITLNNMSYFTKDTLQFFNELSRHNERDWFADNKQRYFDVVRDPFLAFISDVDKDLKKISPYYYGDSRTNGGSLFRIYRDTRFSKDKTPYKTWAGARFKHQDSGTQPAPVFYLHIQPGDHFMGGGIWHPASPVVNRLREFIHNNPRSWQQVKDQKSFKKTFELGGASLKRIPRGYEADHPLAEDLKRKDFVAGTALSDDDILSDQFKKLFIKHCKTVSPLVDYLCAALELEF